MENMIHLNHFSRMTTNLGLAAAETPGRYSLPLEVDDLFVPIRGIDAISAKNLDNATVVLADCDDTVPKS